MNKNIIAVAGMGLGLYLVSQQASAKMAQAVEQINPANNDNMINRAFKKVYGGGFDGQGTLGTDIYELFN